MSMEYTVYQLLYEIAFLQIGIVVGFLLIISTKNGWNILLDPPASLQPVLSKLGKRLLPRKWEARSFYLVGALLILVAGALIVQRIIILAHRLGY